MYKLPYSVQVVIFADTANGRRYLLLKRVESHGGFWQTVTGSLEPGENHTEAAVREVREETGFSISPASMIDLNLTNRFSIAPQWLTRFAPGVTHNEEVCFAVSCERQPPVLDAREHDAYEWASYEIANAKIYWESTRRALDATESREATRPRFR
ncbi:MAG TPA: dihydroneopterin triphosphate diphosphatase [Blastocatellia bacterium]|nr:dihydroneopterin triphosphate diphosphatase [Blastocatellia bacterium]